MTSKYISLDNGHTYTTAADAMQEINDRHMWQLIVDLMDDDAREQVAAELAPCTELEFLSRYLEVASDNLVIG